MRTSARRPAVLSRASGSGGSRRPGQRDRPSRRQLLRQRRDRVPAPPAAHVVAVVEDQHERGGVADRRREQRARAVLPARVALPKQCEHGRRDVGDRRDRRRQVGQEDGRVGVGRLEGDPRDRPSLGLGPLDQRARLAAAGRGGEHDQRGLHVQQPVHQGTALNEREVGVRGPELVLQQWDAEHLTRRIRLLRATHRTPPEGIVVSASHHPSSPPREIARRLRDSSYRDPLLSFEGGGPWITTSVRTPRLARWTSYTPGPSGRQGPLAAVHEGREIDAGLGPSGAALPAAPPSLASTSSLRSSPSTRRCRRPRAAAAP